MSMMEDFAKGREPHPIMQYVIELEGKVRERDGKIKELENREIVATLTSSMVLLVMGAVIGWLGDWIIRTWIIR